MECGQKRRSTNGSSATEISLYKAINNESPVNIPDYVITSIRHDTRSHSHPYIELRTNYDQYKNSFLPRTYRDWNALPPNLVLSTSAEIHSLDIQPELKEVVTRVCQAIHTEGGLIRSMENLGHKELPYPMKSHRMRHFHGSYFAIKFDSSTESMMKVSNDYRQDKDIVKFGVVKTEEEPRRPCLDGPCLFGELPNPDHDKFAFKRKVLKRFKNKKF